MILSSSSCTPPYSAKQSACHDYSFSTPRPLLSLTWTGQSATLKKLRRKCVLLHLRRITDVSGRLLEVPDYVACRHDGPVPIRQDTRGRVAVECRVLQGSVVADLRPQLDLR